jgi:SAM-dependent methyltransferase
VVPFQSPASPFKGKGTMEIVLVAGGMPFGPDTLQHRSLGGSETACIGAAQALRERGHIVTVFCNLPQPGAPDFIQPGHQSDDGIRWCSLEQYAAFISATEVDLLVVQRVPELLQVPHQARKAVLWSHDLATYQLQAQLIGVAWNFDEVWCVSEWHRRQFHEVTGIPLEKIRATRNGIIKYDTFDFGGYKNTRQLVYASRPERGLEHLVKPGGIMSRLPEFTLKVSMYDNFPQHMQGYYAQLFQWAKELPNVEVVGVLTQPQLRQLLEESVAYVYPTDFEETSCMLARECIEKQVLVIHTAKGALIETLDTCGLVVNNNDFGTPEFYERFAGMVREACDDTAFLDTIRDSCLLRTDLYWDGVVEQWEGWAEERDWNSLYSRVWSLVEDSDVIPAIALLETVPDEAKGPWLRKLEKQIGELYPHVLGRESFADYYERYFLREDAKGARTKPNVAGDQRFQAIAEQIAQLPPGSSVLDYGCAEGVNTLTLARLFPQIEFVGVDFAHSNIELCRKYAEEDGLKNAYFYTGSSDDWPIAERGDGYDAVICSEVLEHVMEPWKLADFVESKCKVGGRVIITVPQGPWEANGLYDAGQFPWRAHIWHLNKWAIRHMFGDKKNCMMQSLFCGMRADHRMLGHLLWSHEADHHPVKPIDPLQKARHNRLRQTVTACIIAKDASETILRTLNSIHDQVQCVQVALAECSDLTETLIHHWAIKHPWVQVKIVRVPQIAPGVYGFDDARNASIAGIETDWFFWIDTDEYVSGDFRKYLRNNPFDAYALHQHHFTCDPRGVPTQLDKPARLCRVGRFKFYGKVHEHAEVGPNEGPGFCYLLGDVDIGHTGYVNEPVRRARFSRNFPLLEWDRQVNPDRKLGQFLWMRDIIHRMRYFQEIGNLQAARQLAEEGVQFFRQTWPDSSGDQLVGGMNALGYFSEALQFLGRGLPVNIVVDIGGEQAPIQGVFETEDEVAALVRQLVKDKFAKRNSRYFA